MRIGVVEIANGALAATVMFALMLVGASHLRLGYGRKWVAIACCAISAGLCAAVAGIIAYAAYAGHALADQLANPRAAAILKSDWGADWPREDRTKYSVMLATAAYVERGEIVEFFDLQGRRVPFSPSEQHKVQREERLAYISWLRTTSLRMAFLCLASILIPVVAFLASRTPAAHRLVAWEQRLETKRK